MESPHSYNYPFYLEYSVDKQNKYHFHLSFESVEAARSASEFMQNTLELPITITGNHVIILPKADGGRFGVDTCSYEEFKYDKFYDNYTGVTEPRIGIRSANNIWLHSFLSSNLTNPKCDIYYDPDWTYWNFRTIEQQIPSWHKRQTLITRPFHYINTLFTKFTLFRYFSETIFFPKDLFWSIFKYLFTEDKNLLNIYSLKIKIPFMNLLTNDMSKDFYWINSQRQMKKWK